MDPKNKIQIYAEMIVGHTEVVWSRDRKHAHALRFFVRIPTDRHKHYLQTTEVFHAQTFKQAVQNAPEAPISYRYTPDVASLADRFKNLRPNQDHDWLSFTPYQGKFSGSTAIRVYMHFSAEPDIFLYAQYLSLVHASYVLLEGRFYMRDRIEQAFDAEEKYLSIEATRVLFLDQSFTHCCAEDRCAVFQDFFNNSLPRSVFKPKAHALVKESATQESAASNTEEAVPTDFPLHKEPYPQPEPISAEVETELVRLARESCGEDPEKAPEQNACDVTDLRDDQICTSLFEDPDQALAHVDVQIRKRAAATPWQQRLLRLDPALFANKNTLASLKKTFPDSFDNPLDLPVPMLLPAAPKQLIVILPGTLLGTQMCYQDVKVLVQKRPLLISNLAYKYYEPDEYLYANPHILALPSKYEKVNVSFG